MKNNSSIRHTLRTLLPAVSPLCVLLALLAAGWLSSCVDDTFSPSVSPEPAPSDNTDMYLSVSVPRTFTGSGTDADKENRIETLDILVFRNGVGNASGSYFVHAACEGELTANGKTFEVKMPIGEHLNIHVFANCHDTLVAKGFYNSRGKEMNTLLRALTTGINSNTGNVSAMPMHGYISDVTISEADAGHSLTVPLLRSVASVQVMTNLAQGGTSSNPTLTPGEVTDADGNKNFELRELYVYFYPDNGCVAPAATSYESLAAGDADETRNVWTVSLPQIHSVSDTRQDADEYPDYPRPYSIISPTEVDKLGSLYFFENEPCSDTGFDQPDETTPAATTRLVIGGVYGADKNPDGTPKVTYYRVDFTGTNGKLTEILRNHQYIFNIKTVGGSGYDTPDDAALGVPVNMYIEVLDWVNEVEYTDFDMQNYFYSETKSVRLSRDAQSVQSIAVESDVEATRWEMSFDTANNGTPVLSADGNTLSNDRYRVEKAADGKSLTFTSLKIYNDVTSPQTLDETLYLKVRNLKITYRITQADSSPDDWGNGGDLEVVIEAKPIWLEGMTFEVAPGNLVGYKDAEGNWKYRFADSQGDYSGKWDGGDYFNWSCSNPLDYTSKINSNGWTTDFCTKVTQLDGGWRLPTSEEFRELFNNQPRVFGTYVNSKGDIVKGFYSGTSDKAEAEATQYKYIFLPAAGFRNRGSKEMRKQGGEGYYWASNAGYCLQWYDTDFKWDIVNNEDRNLGFPLRCVRNRVK